MILGEGGNDRLQALGGTGNLLDGGAGRDRLAGGDGDDYLSGGSSADSFVFAPESDFGTDTVRDFDRAVDRIVFSRPRRQRRPRLGRRLRRLRHRRRSTAVRAAT